MDLMVQGVRMELVQELVTWGFALRPSMGHTEDFCKAFQGSFFESLSEVLGAKWRSSIFWNFHVKNLLTVWPVQGSWRVSMRSAFHLLAGLRNSPTYWFHEPPR